MKTFSCTKEVKAFKIIRETELNPETRERKLLGSEDEVSVTNEFIAKHDARIGGYYIEFEDGSNGFINGKIFDELFSEGELGEAVSVKPKLVTLEITPNESKPNDLLTSLNLK